MVATKVPLVVVQFAKSPRLGHCKTRLAPALNEAQRNDLHIALTTWVSESVLAWGDAPLELWLDSVQSHPQFDAAIAERATKHVQQGENLGDKLFHAAKTVLTRAEGVIFVGSDCPFIDGDYLTEAARQLEKNDAVIGPASDGGYVLLGIRKLDRAIFDGIAWGSETVLAATFKAMTELGWSCEKLPECNDIDLPEDLGLLSNPALPVSLHQYANYSKKPISA